MRSNKKYGVGVAAIATVGALALVAASATGASADAELADTTAGADMISSTVRKTVAVTADSSGKASNSVMVTQVSSNGKGQTTVKVPVGTNSARNLDGFSGVLVQNGNAVFDMSLNGSQEQRIMTSTDPGPIEVTAEATLDGQPIEPDQVVNKTGVLKVKYTIVNKEKQVLEVPVRGKDGNTTIEEQEVDAPIGGSVSIVLPQGFNEISAPGANIGGDGQGGSKLSYSLVMFKPLGNPVSTISYESRITNGTLPAAEFTMLPIIPMENSTIQTAYSGFSTGETTGETIAGAGKQIGDGAGQLETGIAKASDGASQLAAGLNGTAIPGANKLADGAGQLADGITGTLQPGANKLAKGANDLADGITGTLQPGANDLYAGLQSFQEAVEGLEGQVTGSPEYKAQMDLVLKAVDGLNQYGEGVKGAGESLKTTGSTTVPGIKGAIPQICTVVLSSQGVPNAAALCNGVVNTPGIPTESGNVSINQAMDGLGTGLVGAGDGLIAAAGPNEDPNNPGILGIAGLFQLALPQVVPGVLEQVTAGLLGTTNCGAKDPKSGKALLCIVGGAAQLSDGINGKVAPGAGQLAEGAGTLASGINDKVAPGAQQVAAGSAQLATGLQPAADGAQQIADGLPAAVEGAGKLSDGGKELAQKGNEAAASFGNQVSEVDAIQKLGLEGKGIPYGKATGENVTTTGAYQITLAAAKTPEQNNALRFGLAIVALIAAAGIGTAIARRNAAAK